MGSMDLIPSDYRQNLGMQRLVKNFFTACVLVLCGIGLAKALVTYLIWRENVQVVQLEQQVQISQQNKTKADEFRQQKQMTEQQLAALDELRGGNRLSMFLQAVDNAYSEGVWFDELRFMRRSATGSLEKLPGAANAGIVVVPNGAETAQSLELNHGATVIGHAMNHSILAEFMRKLGAEPNVVDLRLIDTGTRRYTTIQVVDFNLALQMSQKNAEPNITEPENQEKAQVQP